MKRIWITIGGRVPTPEDLPEDKGNILVIDWDSKKAIKAFSLSSGQEVKEGRSRGCSGIDYHEGLMYIASRQALFALDLDSYEVVKKIHSSSFQGVHQIKSHSGKLHLCVTRRNLKAVVEGDKVKDVIATKYSYNSTDPNIKPPGCFNAIAWNKSGDEFHMYAGPEEIFNFTRGEVVLRGLSTGPHDLCFLNDYEFLYTRSTAMELVKVDLRTESQTVVFRSGNPRRDLGRFNIIGMLRGIAHCSSSNSVFVMSVPGRLYELDADTWEEKAVLNFLPDIPALDGAAEPSPFDMVFDPRDWGERGRGSF